MLQNDVTHRASKVARSLIYQLLSLTEGCWDGKEPAKWSLVAKSSLGNEMLVLSVGNCAGMLGSGKNKELCRDTKNIYYS